MDFTAPGRRDPQRLAETPRARHLGLAVILFRSVAHPLKELHPTVPSLPDTSDLLAAALADRYRVERELGRGGMATVYLAHDLRHDRPVALKVLRPELAASLGPERFLQEIRIAARLQHPHILPVLDSGEAAGTAMVYHAVRRGRVPPATDCARGPAFARPGRADRHPGV